MPAKADPEKLRRELTEKRYRLTNLNCRQTTNGAYWLAHGDELWMGPFDSELEVWQACEEMLEDARREREIRDCPYNQPRKTV